MKPHDSSVFISHASEDKDEVARPLAIKLGERGVRVWFDEFTLKPGDSLRRSIDKGLSTCDVGVVILSPNFFSKEWPQRELDALYSAEIAERSRIIPVWHNIDFKQIAEASPLLADRLALKSSAGIGRIATQISALFPESNKIPPSELAEILEKAINYPTFSSESHAIGVYHRFLTLNAFKEEFHEEFDIALEKDETLIDDDLFEKSLKQKFLDKYRFPSGVYLTTDPPVKESELGWWKDFLTTWASGTLSKKQCRDLAFELDLAEMDEFYILLNVPNYRISRSHRALLEEAMIEIGSGYSREYKRVRKICKSLRALDADG